ncbi:MAG: hypothetical protein QM753_19615 [Thermomicrobiales bacterium]
MNDDRMISPLSRLLLLTLAATLGAVPWVLQGVNVAADDGCEPLQHVSQRFVARSMGNAIKGLSVHIWEYPDASCAAASVDVQLAAASAGDPWAEESVSRVGMEPAGSLSGVDGTWVRVAGAAAVVTWHRGIFFTEDRITLGLTETRGADGRESILLDLACLRQERCRSFYPDGTPDHPDLAGLLLTEGDVGPDFVGVGSGAG